MEAREIVAQLRVDGLNGAGELLGLDEQMCGDDFAIDLPPICRDGKGPQVRYPRPEALEGFVATTAHFHGKDASCEARHSNPYP